MYINHSIDFIIMVLLMVFFILIKNFNNFIIDFV